MTSKQRRPSASVFRHNPSSSFSTVSSAASATSVGSSRSGGSRLLFGEIDIASDRSSETIASVCSLVLSDSSKFLRFWLTDRCRENLISCLSKQDLTNLRLVCHDFSVRAAPSLFERLDIRFKASTFTRPARLAALDRLGFYVKHLTFTIPHTVDTFLPPLIHPENGDELNFTYTPQIESSNSHQAKYGDEDITELLLHQYPPLFHAATNVPAFIRGFSCFFNLKHLEISCPGFDPSLANRRSTVDFTLTSLRIAVERNIMNSLDTLTISPIHLGGLLPLSPLTGSGANPSSAKRWSCIKHLSISTTTPIPPSPHKSPSPQQRNPTKLLSSYVSAFPTNLLTFQLTWLGPKGPLPFPHPSSPSSSSPSPSRHQPTPLFPQIQTLTLQNATTTSTTLRTLALSHASTLQTLELTNVDLSPGSWKEAFAPLVEPSQKQRAAKRPRHEPFTPSRSPRSPRTPRATKDVVEMAEIPIVFTPPRKNPPGASPAPARGYPTAPPSGVHPAARLEAQSHGSPHQHRHHQHRQRQHQVQHSPPLAGHGREGSAAAGRGGRVVFAGSVQEQQKNVKIKEGKGNGGILGRVKRVVRRFGG